MSYVVESGEYTGILAMRTRSVKNSYTLFTLERNTVAMLLTVN
jgi:hypothetical protein